MSSTSYIINCSIAPPCVVYIDEKSSRNEFSITYRKVPLKYANQYLKEKQNQGMPTEELSQGMSAELGNAAPVIYIKASMGEGINDLCTLEQASKMTFTNTDGSGWTMDWSSTNSCFVIKPPGDFKFPEEYHVTFRSNEFYTSAKEGTSTLESYYMNFPDVETKITSVSLYKRYPIKIEYFKATSERVVIGQKTTLSWRVLNAKNCYIDGIGSVETEGSREVQIEKPTDYKLIAENDMGITAYANLKIGCEKPTVKIWSDRKYYHPGDSVTLFWESTSAAVVQITPSPGQVPASGQIVITPQSNTYTATANGYNGSTPDFAYDTVYFETTPWKNKGQVKGVDLAKDKLNKDCKVWAYKDAYYLFSDKTLYKSVDLMNWEKKSELVLSTDMTLNTYSTTVVGDTFLVMGVTTKNSNFVQVATYDFGLNQWSITEVIPSADNLGGSLISVNGNPYYGVLKKPLLLFHTPGKIKDSYWGTPFYYKNADMDTYGIGALRETIYTAAHEKGNSRIHISGMAYNERYWNKIGSTDQSVEGWFTLIGTKGIMYLLTKDWMINLGDFRTVSPYHPPLDAQSCPWTGNMNNTPFLITKDGVLWCCEF